MTKDPILRKLARLREGHAPRILDLFSGCGGLSLGFRLAGCSPIGGVEVNPHAARTYAQNLHRDLPVEDQDFFAIPRDIRSTDPLALLREFGHHSPVAAVDIIVGGPPCQAYARVGRAKLRKVTCTRFPWTRTWGNDPEEGGSRRWGTRQGTSGARTGVISRG